MSVTLTERGGLAEPLLRAWLEHVAQTAIDWLDALDAATADLEDEEGGGE